MNRKLTYSTVPALVFASLFAVAGSSVSLAAETKNQPVEVAAADESMGDNLATRLSKDAYSAMRAVHNARLAIFNGESEKAKELVDKAESDLQLAKAEAATFEAESANGLSTSDVWIPIDGEVALTESFVPSQARANAVEQANSHLANNDKSAAIKALQLAEIDIRFTRYMLPLDLTERHVNEAKELVAAGKFYEANLAMKAAEAGIVMDTIDLQAN